MSRAGAAPEFGASPAQRAWRRWRRNRAAVFGATTLIVLILTALFAPWIAPYGFADGDIYATYAAPGERFWLGADFLGRDLLSRIVYGTRISLSVAFLGAFFALGIGLTYGVISGYYGGRLDNLMMRVVDILYAFPSLLFIILLMVTFKTGFGGSVVDHPLLSWVRVVDQQMGGMFLIVVGISLTSWVAIARLTRGMTLSLRHSDYVQAAVALGARDARILSRHVVPGIFGPLIIRVTLLIPQFIATEAFLSFIGIGATPPTPSWGMMIAEGFTAMRSYPHLALYPGLALAIVMLAFNFLGDGLRDAFDPHAR